MKELRTLVVGPFAVNCYLYWDQESKDGVIIDPGLDAENIIGEVDKAGYRPKAILLTHGHGDHIAAVGDVKGHFKIPLYLGRGEEELLKNPSANVSALIGEPITAPAPDHLLDDEAPLTIGTISFRVLATPGHSPGGVCYLDETEGILFCGDTIFAGSIGRYDFPGCSLEKLMNSIDQKIMKLPDDVICYPGHGPHTTVGNERLNNPFLTGRYFA